MLISTYLKRTSVYPELLAQQAQVGPEMAEAMKQTPMYQLYASIARVSKTGRAFSARWGS